MAITLVPPVGPLGIMAPVLGPWFSTAVTLPALAVANKLALQVALPANTDWFAPATGLLSLFVTTGNAPAALDALQDSDGAWPFPAGRIVAFFRLMPEVEARLHALMGLVPAATANPPAAVPVAVGVPTRPQVRSLAIVLPAGTPLTHNGVVGLLGGPGNVPGNTDADRMAALGLALNGAAVVNGALPMTWLRRPGGALADRDRMLVGLNGQVDFWAFDRRGRAIDPGAVSAWWSWLLNTGVGDDPATGAADVQLFAPGITAAQYPQANALPVVVQVAAQRTVHLVDAHEGPLAAPFLNGRLLDGGAAVTGNLLVGAANSSATLTFSAAPTVPPATAPDNPPVDNAPRPRMAVLPNGNYGATATLWPGGPVQAGLARDFVRVAVVEEEAHLTGVTRRGSRLAVASAQDRRQSAQNRPSSRITVARTANANGVLLAHGQATADALLAIPNAATPTRLVLGVADAAWGGTPAGGIPAAAAGAFPATLADAGNAAPAVGRYRARALVGGGAAANSDQTILVEINLGLANAWVRAWPLGLHLGTGARFRLTGGAGRAAADGIARLVVLLPNGRVDAAALLGMDVLVLLPGAAGTVPLQRSYADCRFARPTPVPGAAPVAVTGTWLVCETGATGAAPLPAGAVPPDGHVVLLNAAPAILDRAAVAAAQWDANTLRGRLRNTDIVSLTAGGFDAAPDRADATGRPVPRLPAGPPGAPDGGLLAMLTTAPGTSGFHRLDRATLGASIAASKPFALQERLEVAAATTAAAAATAVIGSLPPVPWALEPAAHFALGHPFVPAAIERHGTGVALTGAPAVAVAEYVRERTAGLGFGFIAALAEPTRSLFVQSDLAVAAEAATVLPVIADGAGAGPVVAVLRTVAAGMEGLPGVGVGATQPGANLFPFSQNAAALLAWLDTQIPQGGGAGTALRGAAAGPIDSMTRALDRRILASAFGAREALTALLAAIGRAQDFIYLETPAVDQLPIDTAAGGENLNLWQALLNRMAARPGLRVVLCVPSLLAPGSPRKLQEVRDQTLLDAVGAMRAAHPNRFALFSPGAGAGRAVRFASTSVVVDDAFALTGTTHLWRRGLTFDSSLAAAIFDERVVDGRPQDPRGFRIQLMADRLGIPVTRLPEDPAELVQAIRALDARGSARLSAMPILPPATVPASADIDTWNADGSRTDLTLPGVTALFLAAVALTGTDQAIIEG